MTEVLLIASLPPLPATLADAVERFHARGATVRLAGMSPVTVTHGDLGLDDVRALQLVADSHGSPFWRAHYSADRQARTWLHVRNDEWTMTHAERADVLVALDNPSLLSVWHLARRNKRAAARIGLGPALRALDELSGADAWSETDEGEQSPAASAVVPDVSARSSAEHLTGTWSARLRQVARPVVAAWRNRPRRRVPETALERADRLGAVVAADLRAGRPPELLREAYAAELAYADELYAHGDTEQAAASFLQANRLAFHRAAHMDSLVSPLAADPQGYVAPLQDSAVFRRLTDEAGSRAGEPSPVLGRPLRVVLATMDNTHFLDEIRASLATADGVEVRMVGQDDYDRRFWVQQTRMIASELSRDGGYRKRAEEVFRPLYDWADAVFVDWCTPLAYAFTLADPRSTRLIIRLHSYEAFTAWPHLLDFRRIDDMVFVSEHLRQFAEQAIPRLGASGIARHVLPNAVDLRRCVRPKPEESRFTLGMVGYSVVAKDPRWAVEVLRVLRAKDDRYRLLLFGKDLYAGPTEVARAYAEQFHQDLADLEPSGAVRRLGYTVDLPGALTAVGTILSTSVRESQHLGLLEGAASGAVPVVRDWPFFAALPVGPRTMFPSDWVVDTPQEAAERILWVTQDPVRWRALGKQASDEAIAVWDVTRHESDYRKLLGC